MSTNRDEDKGKPRRLFSATTAELAALADKTVGMQAFDTTQGAVVVWTGSEWRVSGSAPAADLSTAIMLGVMEV